MNEIREDVTIQDYLGRKGIRSGDLVLAARSLKTWKWNRDHGDEEEGSWAGFGQALHYMILEPSKFDFCVAVAPKCDKRTMAGKLFYEAFIDRNIGKVIINEEEFATIKSMGAAVNESETARKLLKGAKTELSVFWDDQETGLACQARLDGWRPDINTIVELKGVRSATNYAFSGAICEHSWDRQAAWQGTGLKANGLKVDHHVWIAVEKEAPHLVTVTELDPANLELVERSNAAVLKRIKVATDLNRYPGFDDMISVLQLPEYRVKSLEATL